MGKYTPLGEFLRKQRTRLIPMTFAEIERVIGAKLPKSQQYPAWWSNNPWNNVMTQVWLDAGFQTEQVDIKSRKVVFRRVGAVRSKMHIPPSASSKGPGGPKRHSLFGAMKGTVWIAPGTDLTQPADPHWGEVAYGDKTWDDFK